MTLTDFLLARIAEDEAEAGKASGTGRLWGSDGGMAVWSASVKQRPIAKAMNLRIGAHVARHDPARVMAECEAKRRIVGMYIGPTEDAEGNLSAIGGYGEAWVDAIRFLALPYADHPDYREEWKP